MAKHVCNGALLQCTMGLAPSTFVVTPENKMLTTNQPAATIMDHVPMKNVMPFGMCQSPANPTVAAATAAASGVLTPMPCIPATASPWIAGAPTVLLANIPSLNDSSTLICSYGGTISVKMPGQMTHDIP